MKKYYTILFCFIFISINNSFCQSVIPLKKSNGVYYIKCSISGFETEFIFDTGATIVTISNDLANKLNSLGIVDLNKIKNYKSYTTANGKVVKAPIIELDELTIGEKTINNIEAAIITGQNVPILLGQSAIEKIGTFTFDYNLNELMIAYDYGNSHWYLKSVNSKYVNDYNQLFKKLYYNKNSVNVKIPTFCHDVSKLLKVGNSYKPENDYDTDIYQWNFDDNIYFTSVVNSDSTIAYISLESNKEFDFITGLPFDFILNKTLIKDYVSKIKKYKPVIKFAYLKGEPYGKIVKFKYNEYYIYSYFLASVLRRFTISNVDFETAN